MSNNNQKGDISFNDNTVKQADPKTDYIENPILNQLSKKYKKVKTKHKEKQSDSKFKITSLNLTKQISMPLIQSFALNTKNTPSNPTNSSNSNNNNLNNNSKEHNGSQNKQSLLYMNLLGTHSLSQYLQNSFFNQKRKEFLTYGEHLCVQILKISSIFNYGPQEIICKHCHSNLKQSENFLYIILQGEVEKNINNKIFTQCYKGDYFELSDVTSATTETHCVVCEIQMKKYQMLIEKFTSMEYSSEINFLLCMNIFKKCNRIIIEKILSLITKKTYNKGEMIIEQGAPVDALYIIRKGQCEIEVSLSQSVIKEFDMNALDSIAKCPNEPFSSNRIYELKNSYTETNKYKLMILNPCAMINDIEILKKSENCFFSVKAFAEGTVLYVIPKDKIEEGVLSENIVSEIEKSVKEKKEIFNRRINRIYIDKRSNTQIEENKFKQIVLHKINRSPVMNETFMIKTHKKSPHSVGMKSLVSPLSSLSSRKMRDTSLPEENYSNYYERELAKSIRNMSSGKKTISMYKSKSSIDLSSQNTFYRSGNSTMREKNNNWLCLLKRNAIEKKHKRLVELQSNNHRDISKSFGINKLFYLKNNTSIIENKLSDIVLSQKMSY